MSTYRAKEKYVDDGTPSGGVRKVWRIDGPEPFGGLTAKDEEQALGVVATLNGPPMQVVLRRHADFVAERSRLDTSITAVKDAILRVPDVTRCHANFNERGVGAFTVDGGDDVAIAREILDAGPGLMTMGRVEVRMAGGRRVQFDRFTE